MAPASTLSQTGEGHWANFYPLSIGNRWEYSGFFRLILRPTGSPAAETLFVGQSTLRTLSGTTVYSGEMYLTEDDQWTDFDEGGSRSGSFESFYRQDATGLYAGELPAPPTSRAPVLRTSLVNSAGFAGIAARIRRIRGNGSSADIQAAITRGAAAVEARVQLLRSAGGLGGIPSTGSSRTGSAQPWEITRLRYPLHPGQEWDIRQEPDIPFHSRVEAVESLRLPAGRFTGYRIRITPPGSGSSDLVLVWYGTAGYLGESIHVEAPMTDQDGSVIGTFVGDQVESLDRLTIR